MSQLPSTEQQVVQAHAGFIVLVVQCITNADKRPQLEPLLKQAEENGWQAVSAAIRQIVDGQRELSRLGQLDEEDRIIVEAILRGMQDPASLPDPQQKADPTLAAPGLAHMLQAAASGDVRALTLVSQMAEQMSKAGGPLARLAAVIRPLINGERDPDKLCKGLDGQTEKLLLDILAELGKQARH